MQSRIVICIVSWHLHRDTYRIVTLLVIHSTSIYIYIINKHRKHTYIMSTKTFILDAINRLTALIVIRAAAIRRRHRLRRL